MDTANAKPLSESLVHIQTAFSWDLVLCQSCSERFFVLFSVWAYPTVASCLGCSQLLGNSEMALEWSHIQASLSMAITISPFPEMIIDTILNHVIKLLLLDCSQ